MIDVKNFTLTDDELKKCVIFSKTSAPNQQAIEFGQKTTKPRSEREVSRDNLIGKIAEVAFSKIMKENYGIDVPLDFNFYPRGKWDDQDAIINGWRIDVKGTRSGGRWMLIEWNKLCFRQRDNNLSHVYAMFSVDWNRELDVPTGRVSFEGVASIQRLRIGDKATRVLKKGDFIPETHTTLQADNFAIQFKDLYKHLNHFVEIVLKSPPPSTLTDNFINPYTGQTTLEIVGNDCRSKQPLSSNLTISDEQIKDERVQKKLPRIFRKIKQLFCRS